MMELIREGKLISTFYCRTLILECAFISSEEKAKNLDYGINIEQPDSQYTNAEFEGCGDDIDRILYVDENKDIDFEGLPKKIPISYKVYKDKVQFGTITCAMHSPKISDHGTCDVLQRAADSSVDNKFAEVNDEIIRIFIDFHWERNFNQVVAAGALYIVYGCSLAYSAFDEGRIVTLIVAL